jgi:hypothetical protein
MAIFILSALTKLYSQEPEGERKIEILGVDEVLQFK